LSTDTGTANSRQHNSCLIV